MAPEIIETCHHAMLLATSQRKVIYVFRYRGAWCFSGRVTEGVECFYIVFPNGSIDQVNIGRNKGSSAV